MTQCVKMQCPCVSRITSKRMRQAQKGFGSVKPSVIIIGSGLGGLGAAVRLLAQGYEVKLFEKLDKLGGRAYVFEKNGFKFDAGPTVITAPFILDEIWQTAGRSTRDYFELVPLDPFYRIFDYEGKHLDYNGDHEFILDQIEKWNPADRAGYDRLIRASKEIFDTGMPLISEPFLDIGSMLRVAPALVRLQSFRSVYGYVSSYIKNDFLRRCFSFHPLLIGGNPFDASSLYVLIHHLERAWGVHWVKGGTGAMIAGFERLIRELGGDIQLNAEVQEIVVMNGKATGVRLANGELHQADLVISNADVAWTYLNLVKPEHRRHNNNRRIQNMRYSMSLFVSYFGTKRQYRDTQLKHHNIILSKRYKELLHEIFDGHILPDDFSLYLHMPSITDASIAPEGHEAFYVLSPVPNLQANLDWQKIGAAYEDKILQFLEENYLPDLRANIVVKHHIDPRYFEKRLNSYLGAGFSVQPLLLQSAWFRPHNRSEDIANLYFVGAGTHPGGGVPGVLSSAKLVANLIARDFPLPRAEQVQYQTGAV